jgi:hypothetical protein
METASKLTPALKRWLAFIADGGERGRMELQITASGGRAGSQLQALRQAGYVEYVPAPFVTRGRFEPDRVRVTEAGRKALVAAAAKEPITYCRDDDRYIVYLGDERIGFVRRETPPDGYAPDGRWKPSTPGWYARAGSRPAAMPEKRCSAAISRHAPVNGAEQYQHERRDEGETDAGAAATAGIDQRGRRARPLQTGDRRLRRPRASQLRKLMETGYVEWGNRGIR